VLCLSSAMEPTAVRLVMSKLMPIHILAAHPPPLAIHLKNGSANMVLRASEKYSRIAKAYDLLEWPIERLLFHKLRKEAIEYACDKTLEVGVGTGKNLSFYPESVELVAIDFSPGMLNIAEKKAKGIDLKSLQLREMDVEHLDFTDNSFDVVVSTFVFCTVPDPIAGLKELYRVLKPNGKAVFLEHMKSKNPIINIMLYIMNIASSNILGTSMVRKTQQNIEQTGFVIKSVENKAFDIVRLIIAEK